MLTSLNKNRIKNNLISFFFLVNRNMQLKKIKRAEKKGTESVMDEKFSLQFQSSFAVGHGDVVFSVRIKKKIQKNSKN